MDRTEARLECVRIAAQQCGGLKLIELAARLIALVEAPEVTIELHGADNPAGDADRRSVQKDPDVAAAPPDEDPGCNTAKDPEGGTAGVGPGRPAETNAPAPDGAAQAEADRNEPAPPKPAAPPGGRIRSAPASGPALGLVRPAKPTPDTPTPAAGAREKGLSPSLAETLRLLPPQTGALVEDGVAAKQLAKKLSLTMSAARARLKELRKRGLAECHGRTRLARWFAVEAEPKPEPDTTRTDSGPAAADSEAPPPAKDCNLPAPQPDPCQRIPRRCLGGCDKDFMSDGPGNRICPACTKNVKNHTGGLDDALGVVT